MTRGRATAEHESRSAGRRSLEKHADAVSRGAVNPGRMGGSATASEKAWGAKLASTTGVPLSQSVSEPLQQRTGKSLAGVNVYSNPTASQMVKARGAKAATIGRHIGVASEHFRPGTAEGDRLLAHEAAHVLQQGGQPRGIQHEDEDVLQAWLDHPTPLYEYTELQRILTPDDWAALNAAAQQRMRNALAGATLLDPEGVRMVRELTVPVSLLFKPTTNPTRRADWRVDAFELALGQALSGLEMDKRAIGAMVEEDELCRWIDANAQLMGGQLTISLIDPFGEVKAPSKLLFSYGEQPIPTVDGALYAGHLDPVGSGTLQTIREQSLSDLAELSVALSAAIDGHRVHQAGQAVLQTEHYRLAAQTIGQAERALIAVEDRLSSIGDPYRGRVSGLSVLLLPQFHDLGVFSEEDRRWRLRNPRPTTENERFGGAAQVSLQHLYGGRPQVGPLPVTGMLFGLASNRLGNALRGGQYDHEQGAADLYDEGRISMATYDEFVDAVQARGDAMIFTTGVVTVLGIGLGFLFPPLGIAGSFLAFGTLGAAEAVAPMVVGDLMVANTTLSDPSANAMWGGLAYDGDQYAMAAGIGFGLGGLLGGGGAALSRWRAGPALVHAAEQGMELPAIQGARATVLGRGRVRVEVPGQLGHMEFTSSGWRIWGPTGEGGTMRVLESGAWARSAMGAPDDMLAGTLYQHPFGVGVGQRGWGVATPEGMQSVGSWGVDVWPNPGASAGRGPGPWAATEAGVSPRSGPLILPEGGVSGPVAGAPGPVAWPGAIPNLEPGGGIGHLLWRTPEAWAPSPVLNGLPREQLPLIGSPTNPGRWVHGASGSVEPRFLFGAPDGALLSTVPSGSGPMVILDVPGVSRSALVRPSAAAAGPARAYPSGMGTNTVTGIRSHLIPLRDGTYASTRFAGNYVDHLSSTYNSRIRATLERRFRTAGHEWHAFNVMDSTPRYGPAGHPIPQAEIIVEMAPTGARGWRFPNDLSYPNATAVPSIDDAIRPYAMSADEVHQLLRGMGL